MKNHILFLTLIGLLAFATLTAAQPKNTNASVTGMWLADVTTSMGSGSPTFTFKQDGEQLTGQYSGQFGEAPLSGTVKGQDIRFSFNANAQGNDLTFVYSGQIGKDGEIKGTLDAGVIKGTWKAKRQPQK